MRHIETSSQLTTRELQIVLEMISTVSIQAAAAREVADLQDKLKRLLDSSVAAEMPPIGGEIQEQPKATGRPKKA